MDVLLQNFQIIVGCLIKKRQCLLIKALRSLLLEIFGLMTGELEFLEIYTHIVAPLCFSLRISRYV